MLIPVAWLVLWFIKITTCPYEVLNNFVSQTGLHNSGIDIAIKIWKVFTSE